MITNIPVGTLSPPRDVHPSHVRAALARLNSRRMLVSVAREIFSGLRLEVQSDFPACFVGELENGTACGDPPDPNTIIRFECSNDFDCGKYFGTFNCEDVYGTCGNSGNDYECKNNFECKQEVYECWDFVCGDSGAGNGKFDCTSKFDFMCSGPVYQCYDDFDCTSGHLFWCEDDHECQDEFTCAATGNPACNAINQYSRPEGGGDLTAGDFVCGFSGMANDEFDCLSTFDCIATDEFDCVSSSDFDCGTGDATDSFQCGQNTIFECDDHTSFDCRPANKFQCKGQYQPPPNG